MSVPGVGGLSTAGYELFRRMLADGHDAHMLNLIDMKSIQSVEERFGVTAGNPSGLPNVDNCTLSLEPADAQPDLAARMAAINPDIVVAFGHIAARLAKRASPARRTVFMTGTCRQAQDYVSRGVTPDAVTLASHLASARVKAQIIHADEQRGVTASDLVVTHSDLTLSMFERFYPESAGKMYPSVISFAEWICDGARQWEGRSRPFNERDIDVCFIASDWGRTEKNYPWIESISKALRTATIHVVGDVPYRIPGVTHHGFLASREPLFDLLARTRCVSSVSRIDAAPGVLFEAAVLGCNVVASKNCGNWELCHAELLVDPFQIREFTQNISRALKKKYEDGRGVFLARNSYADFVAMLSAFSRPFESQAAVA